MGNFGSGSRRESGVNSQGGLKQHHEVYAIVVNKQGQCLFIRPTNAQEPYKLPGGYSPSRERSGQSLSRLLQEQLEITVRQLYLADIGRHSSEFRTEFYYFVQCYTQQVNPAENYEYQWVNVAIDQAGFEPIDPIHRKWADFVLRKISSEH